jgi:hypothetical protein
MGSYIPTNRVAEYTQEGKQLMNEYPVAAVSVAFGLGVAAGLVIANMLVEEQQPQRWRMAHRLGEQLLDAMNSVLPDAMSKSLRG